MNLKGPSLSPNCASYQIWINYLLNLPSLFLHLQNGFTLEGCCED